MAQKVFTREATGLVSDISPLDSFVISIQGVTIIAIYLFYSNFMYASPNDNPFLAIGYMIIPLTALAADWALLTIVFPRSGGDYVFNTRSLNPALGVMTDFLYVSILPSIAPIFIIIALQILSDMFNLEGLATGSSAMSSVGSLLSVPNVQFVLTCLLMVVGLLFLIGRTRIFVRTQSMFVMAQIAIVIILAGLVMTTSNSSYQAQFTSFFKVDYNSVIQTATAQGMSAPSWTGASMFGTSLLIFWLAGPQYGSFVSGETKRPQKTFLYSILAANFVMTGLFLLVGAVSFNTFGFNFSYAANYLASIGKNPLPLSQADFLRLAVPLFANPILLAIVFIIMAGGTYMFANYSLMAASRKIFAWSIDRLLPAKFSDISGTFKTPILSAVVVWLIGMVYTAVYVYGPGIFAVISGFGVVYSGLIWGVSALSGVVLPARKELFAQAPPVVQKKIGSIPLLSIIGLVSFVSIVGILIVGQLIPAIQGGLPVSATVWTFGIWFAGLLYYYLAKYYRSRSGLDLGLAYKQIPPE